MFVGIDIDEVVFIAIPKELIEFLDQIQDFPSRLTILVTCLPLRVLGRGALIICALVAAADDSGKTS